MLVSYDVAPPFVDKHVVCKGRLFVISCHAGFDLVASLTVKIFLNFL